MFRLRSAVTSVGIASAAGSSSLLHGTRFASSGSKDFYKTLGVSKTASKDEIKKAYRKRALETHPDQGGKKEEFAEVAEAYEVLSNAEKRQMYDQYGSEGMDQMGGMGGPGGMGGFGGRRPEDIFSEFFRQSGFGGFHGGMQQAGVPPLDVKLRLTLEEIAKGASKTVRVTRPTICGDCRGNGTKSQQPKPQCSQCHGSGQVIQQHRMGAGMVQQVVSQCPRCGGTGSVAKKDDECPRCHGAGHRNMAQEINLQIPPGVPSGATMVVQGEGGTMPNVPPGDLHVHLEQVEHAVFTRRGADLTATMEITLSEALLGFERPMKMVDGRTVCVKGPDGVVKHNSVIRLAGEGMPKAESGKGDLYVFLTVAMPRTLTAEQKAAITTAFGAPAKDANATSGNTVVGKLLRESKEQLLEQKASAWADEERGGGRGQRGGRGSRGGPQQGGVECAQQ